MRIITIIGARPQFIKAAALSRVLLERGYKEILLHTGQHFDDNMSKIFFDELDIPEPKYNLGVSGGMHGKMTGRLLAGIEEILLKEQPELVIIYGDTNTTLAGALAAVKLHLPVAHVEAGGRIGTLSNPEEVNRICADHLSTFLFAPTEVEKNNLEKENLGDRAWVTGNIMFDSYRFALKKVKESGVKPSLISLHDGTLTDVPDNYCYLTCHREENTTSDRVLSEIFKAMMQLPYDTVYPVHPRNQERAIRLIKNMNAEGKIKCVEPVGYLESVALMQGCEKVVTDSGGLQCEAFYAEKQCVTVFDYIVWPQTMVTNRNQRSKAEANEILKKLQAKQTIDSSYLPFGDGHAADRIVEIIGKALDEQ